MLSGSSVEGTPLSATPSEDTPRLSNSRRRGTKGLRITHACDRCRVLRVKCSGGPRCSKCDKEDTVCKFGDRKREMNKKELRESIDRTRRLEDEKIMLALTLRRISESGSLPSDQQSDVLLLLQKLSEPEKADQRETASRSRSMSTTTSLLMRQQDDLRENATGGGEHSALAEVGSPGQKAEVNRIPHLNNGSGMVGFIGKMSETSWMGRIHEYLKSSSSIANLTSNSMELDTLPKGTIPPITYFMDEEDILSVDEDHVNHYQLPSQTTSLLLCGAFFHAMHGGFPFVLPSSFFHDLSVLFSRGSPASAADHRFLALCNMVWATGARWVQTMQFAQETFAEHHTVYYARARALGCDHRIQFDHPDLQMLQCIAITAFYLFVNGSIQRAWNLIGQAVRHSVSMGLHLQFPSNMVDGKEYEARRCLWLAIYRLEILLSEILGRPSAIQFGMLIPQAPSFLPDMDTLSAPGDTDSSKLVEEAYSVWMQFVNTDRWAASSFSGPQVPWAHFQGIGNAISTSYLPAILGLSQICTEIAAKIFFHHPKQTWYNVQCTIQELEEELQSWTDNLSDELKIENVGRGNLDPRPNLDLAMYFCSVQILLYRPCLCKIEIENESASSKEFNTIRARLCVQAALDLIGLFPESPVAAQTRQILPWWSTLHYLCQVGTVLLLEMCLEMEHLQDESQKDDLRHALAKVVEYLGVLSPCSKSVYRANQIFRLFMEKISKLYLISPFGRGSAEPLMPRNWDERDDADMVAMLNALR